MEHHSFIRTLARQSAARTFRRALRRLSAQVSVALRPNNNRLLRQFCRKHGVILDRALGVEVSRGTKKYGTLLYPTVYVDPYTVRGPPENGGRYDGHVDALNIERIGETDYNTWGMKLVRPGGLANSVVQLSYAVLVAKALGVQRIYVGRLPIDVFWPDHAPRRIDEMEFVFEDGRAHPESYVLSGVFFKNFTLAPITRRLEAKDKWTVFDRYAVFDRYVVPLIGIPASTHPPDFRTLHIHMRAADIFEGEGSNSFYVQPPLAFYKCVIEDARRRGAITRIVIVCEDTRNPCTLPLKAWVEAIGMKCVLQSGSLPEDLTELGKATSLVVGRGSFGVAVARLAKWVRRIYSFEFTQWENKLRAKGIDIILVRDTSGRYTKVGEWANTEKQRRLMIDYPVENLAIREVSIGRAT